MSFGRAITTRAAALLLILSGGIKAALAGGYYVYEPSPIGTLQVARPAITWKIRGEKDTRITGVTMEINAKPVAAAYSEAEQAVVYTPEQALAPGEYTVTCQVVLDGTELVDREWRFSVAREPFIAVPEPDAGQRALVAAANAYRRAMALPALLLDARLCAAAAAHSAYLTKNHLRTGHDQQPGKPGFVGKTPAERVTAFGFFGGCYENVNWGEAGVGSVGVLFHAPYHRLPFLQPGAPSFGAGVAGQNATQLFGLTEAEGTVVYPADGQKGVPMEWDGNESPDPLRLHNASGPVGYPITLAHFTAQRAGITVKGATLSTAADGKPVPVYLNSPANDDHLTNAAFVIPQQPLKPGTTYVVSVTAETEAGQDISRTWRFTTAGKPQKVSRK